MNQLSPAEIKVKNLVDTFFADRITSEELRRGLAREKIRLEEEQRRQEKLRRRKAR